MISAVLSLVGSQTPWNQGRGIARYITEHASALAAQPGLDLVLHADGHLPRPTALDHIPESVPRLGLRPPPVGGLVYHVMSPFEELPVDRVWPVWARRPDVALAVTLYDLIPVHDPDSYLVTPWLTTYYRTRLEMLRRADAVLTISSATAEDAVGLLGVDRSRVHNISTGCSEQFRPAAAGELPLAAAQAAIPQLREDFLLYVGGLDPRKNVDRLVAAYAALPAERRSRSQLVIACRPEPDQARSLGRLAAALGVSGSVLVTGFVSDELLLALYQSCRALIFPSLREGFGLPVLEAMRCGAAVVVSDIPSLVELVPDRAARFDPKSDTGLRSMLDRVIADDAFVAGQRGRAGPRSAPHTWSRVAAATGAAYASALSRRSPMTCSRNAS